jgi:hypothetical protein
MAASQPAELIKVTIGKVKGNVQVRRSENEAWQPAKEGAVLDAGAEFRTGLRSNVVLLIPPDQQITVDSLTNTTVLRAVREGGRVKTDLGMKYGRTTYEVEEAGVEHEATIRSPAATLAVRGTRNMSLYDHAAFAPVALASQPVQFKNLRGQVVGFGRVGQQTKMAGDQPSPADDARAATTVDSVGKFAGRTNSENAIVSYIARVDPSLDLTKFPVLRILTDPNRPDTSGGGTLPILGQLRFFLFWSGQPSSNVDLSVTAPDHQVVSIAHPTTADSGHHLGDGVASKSGFGQEIVLFERMFPTGTYTIQTDLKTPGKADAQVFVVRDPLTTGTQIGQFSFKLTAAHPSATHTIHAP